MDKQTFLQTMLLMIIAGVIFYIVCPKYEYIDDQTPDLLRFNKIRGVLEVCKDGDNWGRVVSKSIAKVERSTITYEEFIQKRNDSQEMLRAIKSMSK
ncbi:MAG: hypothetical protein M0Q96_04350 [Candidatus Omnitrophica bacterium]|jgi:hypothetical protein|nr:hypothetical protein [Candidatus Omnitrophota bacterium]